MSFLPDDKTPFILIPDHHENAIHELFDWKRKYFPMAKFQAYRHESAKSIIVYYDGEDAAKLASMSKLKWGSK